jgi:dihydrolipoamide dehydrogenase
MDQQDTELMIIGGGPGGYTAAFYAADRGMKVTLVDRFERLGGICMNHGCIPSKALIQTTAFLEQSSSLKKRGIHYDDPRINLKELNDWKNSVVSRLGGGLESLAKSRGIKVIHGKASFEEADMIRVETEDGQTYWKFQHAIVATGSKAALPEVFDLGNPRIMTSREALEVDSIPEKLVVVGGGYIGLELGTVYARMGSEVTLIEALDSLLPGVDEDLVKPVFSRVKNLFSKVELSAEVKQLATRGEQIEVTYSKGDEETTGLFDKVLVAIGRKPETEELGISEIGLDTDNNGFISVDEQGRTSLDKVYAIGDVCREPMLAHKATKEARVAVDAIFGEASSATDFVIPAIVFTDPEVAWCGLTETEAESSGIDIKVSTFSWKASGRALTHERTDGLTKLVVDATSERLLGVGLCGHGAAELIAEGTVALELGASVRDLAELIHPHPTLSETYKEAAEAFYGTATHQPK